MSCPLYGRLAFITGAGSGIGRAVAKTLSRDGARVVAADVNLEAAQETIAQLGEDASALKLDVTSSLEISKALEATIKRYKKPPSIIVNSAGITRDSYLLKMMEPEYDDVYKVNLKGTFMVMQKFAQAMVDYRMTGSIVNLSSIVAKMNNVGQANYAATKAGVISLTEVAAKEFGKFNIRVNAILPGYIDTPMVAAIPDHITAKVLERCPMRRLGKPEEIADMVSFLSSLRASYVNGASIPVTGGLY